MLYPKGIFNLILRSCFTKKAQYSQTNFKVHFITKSNSFCAIYEQCFREFTYT